jgi:SAM-dependent methyltransferase
VMDARRSAWLAERRAAVGSSYDDEAATYGDDEYPAPMQHDFVQRLVATCPPGGLVLDAPCGTGRYFDLVTGAGRRVVGIDQSSGMLGRARARGVAEELHHVGLQELAFENEFDGAMTVDAMENVPPEDWPRVLANLQRSLRPGGHLFLTVEEIDEGEIESAFAEARRAGSPAIRGEVVEGDTAGYHVYPGRERALSWIAAAGFTLVEEAYDQQDGWGYRHLLATTGAGPS